MKRVFISDCEGPISKNDNAFELTARFVPKGDKLFTLISKYDDVLADVLKKPGYSPGSTLKLILPFLKAYDVTDKKMEEFSSQNVILIADSKDTLKYISTVASTFIVSTSYEHYIKAMCRVLQFPFLNTYCTKLSIDNYSITEIEKTRLKEIAGEIIQAPMIDIPSTAKSIEDFSRRDRETIWWLEEIFWTEIADMSFGRIFSEVDTIGGAKKAEAVEDVAERLHVELCDVMYVGDSITDVEAFQLVKESGGLTISFNGNQYAIENSEVAVLCESSLVTALLADMFCKLGKLQTLHLVENWKSAVLRESSVNQLLFDRLSVLYPNALPKVQIVTARNMASLAKESNSFRKTIRGTAIGRLG